jgi:hypothetical protein
MGLRQTGPFCNRLLSNAARRSRPRTWFRGTPRCPRSRAVGAGALAFLTADGLFRSQSPAFFAFMADLARDGDAAADTAPDDLIQRPRTPVKEDRVRAARLRAVPVDCWRQSRRSSRHTHPVCRLIDNRQRPVACRIRCRALAPDRASVAARLRRCSLGRMHLGPRAAGPNSPGRGSS